LKRGVTAALVGVMETEYRTTLVRLLAEIGISAVDATEPNIPRPDLVLATIPFDHVEDVLQVAQWRADGSPVVALLPSDDASMLRRAQASGAKACYVLGASSVSLKSMILGALAEARRNDGDR
jgi:hypothetical protein